MGAIRTPRDGWVEAGLAALAAGGPDAVRVEALAKQLGVTKGGFYGHFADREALLTAMLDAWERESTDEVLDRVEREGGDPRTKIRRAGMLTFSSDRLLPIDLAIRDWARRDAAVAERLRRVDNRRMALLREMIGTFCPDPDEVEARSLLAFCLLIGAHFLAADHGDRTRDQVLARAGDLLLETVSMGAPAPQSPLAGAQQRERPQMDPDKRRQFVRDHRTCIFGYARRNDGPAMTVVYYVMDGDDILISTMDARSKAKAVDRDPRVSLCVLDEHWPPTYLQVYGTASIERDRHQSADLLRRVIELMAGEPVPDERRAQIFAMSEEEQRVVIRVRPYATFATPPRHVNHMEDLDTLTHWTSNSLPW